MCLQEGRHTGLEGGGLGLLSGRVDCGATQPVPLGGILLTVNGQGGTQRLPRSVRAPRSERGGLPTLSGRRGT
jgi:hypothetical protein